MKLVGPCWTGRDLSEQRAVPTAVHGLIFSKSGTSLITYSERRRGRDSQLVTMECNACAGMELGVLKIQQLLHERFGSSEGLETCEDCNWTVCESCVQDPASAQCRCSYSNLGRAYADMAGAPGRHMGARGGKSYMGPFKCAAQREMESKLMLRREPGHAPFLDQCCYAKCGKVLGNDEAKVCSRCRSVVYCSQECQTSAWTTSDNGTHKVTLRISPHKCCATADML